jgi:hypothetical protein
MVIQPIVPSALEEKVRAALPQKVALKAGTGAAALNVLRTKLGVNIVVAPQTQQALDTVKIEAFEGTVLAALRKVAAAAGGTCREVDGALLLEPRFPAEAWETEFRTQWEQPADLSKFRQQPLTINALVNMSTRGSKILGRGFEDALVSIPNKGNAMSMKVLLENTLTAIGLEYDLRDEVLVIEKAGTVLTPRTLDTLPEAVPPPPAEADAKF